MQAAIDERIKPVGRVLLDGRRGARGRGSRRRRNPDAGRNRHDRPAGLQRRLHRLPSAPGTGGAPPVGDVAAWAPRIAQGMDTLYMHALMGFQGTKGFMPPKGGRVDLSDDEIKAAVDYLVGAGALTRSSARADRLAAQFAIRRSAPAFAGCRGPRSIAEF